MKAVRRQIDDVIVIEHSDFACFNWPIWTNFARTKFKRKIICLGLGTMCTQGIDGSAHKPTLRQDTGYMVEKTYLDIAPYLGAFGAYLMPP